MLLKTFVRMKNMIECRKGQGMTEYLLLTGLIAVALIGIVIAFKNQLSGMFNKIMGKLGGQGSAF